VQTAVKASAPLPTFVTHWSWLGTNLGSERGASKFMILVPLSDLKFLLCSRQAMQELQIDGTSIDVQTVICQEPKMSRGGVAATNLRQPGRCVFGDLLNPVVKRRGTAWVRRASTAPSLMCSVALCVKPRLRSLAPRLRWTREHRALSTQSRPPA